jgi:hypothetical protein
LLPFANHKALTASDRSINNPTLPMDHHDNNSHDHHDSMSMPTTMPMTFFASTTTPLYTTAWQPTTQTRYALTCLFLVLLCIVFRALLAARCNLQVLLNALGRFGRRRATERASSCCTEVDEEGDFDGDGDLSNEKNQFRDRVRREDSKKRTCGGGRAGEILLRALLDTSLAVVSYLL